MNISKQIHHDQVFKRGVDMNGDEWYCDCNCQDEANSHNNDCLIGAIHGVAHALRLLGNADAATSMGAIESLSSGLQSGLTDIAGAIDRKTHLT